MFVIHPIASASDNPNVFAGRQVRESLRKWVTPPDPSTNHTIACGIQHDGSAQWFFRGSIFSEWKSTGSLLWIYGKRMFFPIGPRSSVDDRSFAFLAGSGKSILWLVITRHSTIIQDIQTSCKAGLGSIAYFYFDFRDLDKQNCRNLLPSLLVQLAAQSSLRCDVLHRLYLEHEEGTQKPTEAALTQCLKDMLAIPN